MLAKDGRVVVVGSRGKVEIDPRETMKRDADVRGHDADERRRRGAGRHPRRARRRGWRTSTLRPIVGKELPLAEAAKAARGGHGQRGVREDRAGAVRRRPDRIP